MISHNIFMIYSYYYFNCFNFILLKLEYMNFLIYFKFVLFDDYLLILILIFSYFIF
jgi:hypothetical protein